MGHLTYLVNWINITLTVFLIVLHMTLAGAIYLLLGGIKGTRNFPYFKKKINKSKIIEVSHFLCLKSLTVK